MNTTQTFTGYVRHTIMKQTFHGKKVVAEDRGNFLVVTDAPLEKEGDAYKVVSAPGVTHHFTLKPTEWVRKARVTLDNCPFKDPGEIRIDLFPHHVTWLGEQISGQN
jgi:hypothetical protein